MLKSILIQKNLWFVNLFFFRVKESEIVNNKLKTELHQKVEEVTNLERRYLIWILNVINLILSQWINVLWIWVIFLIFVFFLSFYNLKCCIFLIVLFRVKDMENYGDKVQEELQEREKELSSLERKCVNSKIQVFFSEPDVTNCFIKQFLT